jgi:hypothetical protein
MILLLAHVKTQLGKIIQMPMYAHESQSPREEVTKLAQQRGENFINRCLHECP